MQTAATTYGVTGGLIGPAAKTTAAAAGGGLLAGVAALLLPITIAIGGVYAAVKGGDYVAKATGQDSLKDIFHRELIVADYELGKIWGRITKQNAEEMGMAWAQAEKNFLDGLKKKSADPVTGGNPSWYQNAFTEFQNYQTQIADNNKRANAALLENDRQTAAQILSINAEFNKNRIRQDQERAISESRTLEDFRSSSVQRLTSVYRELKKQEEEYYAGRLELAQSNSKDALREEEDHQKEMLRLRQDHDDNMVDLTAKRDVLGMLREMRSYEKSSSRSEEDYSTASRRRQEDYRDQLSQMASNFAKQRAERLADAAQQQADAQAQFNLAKKRRDEDYARTKAEQEQQRKDSIAEAQKAHDEAAATLRSNLQEENAQVEKAYVDRINALDNFIGRTTAAYTAGLERQYVAFNNWLQQAEGIIISRSGSKTHDAGGYMQPGQSYVNRSGMSEWALSPSSTKLAEQIMGSRLTQQNMISSLIAGRSGGGSRSSVSSRGGDMYFSGITAQDRLMLEGWIDKAVDTRVKAELND
jgi:hypothetical protein